MATVSYRSQYQFGFANQGKFSAQWYLLCTELYIIYQVTRRGKIRANDHTNGKVPQHYGHKRKLLKVATNYADSQLYRLSGAHDRASIGYILIVLDYFRGGHGEF